MPDWNYDASFTFGQTRVQRLPQQRCVLEAALRTHCWPSRAPDGMPVCRGGQTGCVPWNIWNPAIPITQAALNYISVPGARAGASSDEDIWHGFVSGDLTNAGVKLPTCGRRSQGRFRHRIPSGDLPRSSPMNEFIYRRTSPGSARQSSVSMPATMCGRASRRSACRWRTICPASRASISRPAIATRVYTSGFNTNTFKLGLTWSPISDVRLRASYNRAVRVPNVAELSKPAVRQAGCRHGSLCRWCVRRPHCSARSRLRADERR